MTVIVVNRFLLPDHSAASQIASDLAIYLAQEKLEVRALCSRQLYGNPAAQLAPDESISGVCISRVRSTKFGRARLAGRMLDYLSYYLSSAIALLRHARRGSIVIAMTDPPLLGVVAALVAWLRGAYLVQWLQDVFPEIAVELGVVRSGIGIRILKVLRNWSLRRSDAVVVIGERMASLVATHCKSPPTVIPNWALEEADQLQPNDGDLRTEWLLAERFVVGYSGNMGRAHSLEELVDAAAQLKNDPTFRLLLVGDGAQRSALEAKAHLLGSQNVVFRPYQPRDRLRASLQVPDIHVVSLDPALEGLIVPSKFVGVVALGKPVLFIGDAGGEIGSMIRDYNCGVVVPAGDVEALTATFREFASDRASGGVRLKRMSQQAMALWTAKLTRKSSHEAWFQLLSQLSASTH